MGNLGARAGDSRCNPVYGLVPDEVAKVGDHPWRARLDELIIVKLFQVILERCKLFGYHVDQSLERTLADVLGLRQLGIPQPVQGR
jgi:hypothetical protein